MLSQIDLDASIQTRRYTTHRGLTVAIDQLVFHKPLYARDGLQVYATTGRVGRTSISIRLGAKVERKESLATQTVTERRFVSMAIDESRQPIPITRPLDL